MASEKFLPSSVRSVHPKRSVRDIFFECLFYFRVGMPSREEWPSLSIREIATTVYLINS